MAREAWKKQRTDDIVTSNNKVNPNQNVCAYSVARYFRVAHKVKYLHRMNDLLRALRKKWTVRSRMSMVKKLLAKKKVPITVSQIRKIVSEITKIEDAPSVKYEEFYDPNEHRNWVQETYTINDIKGYVLLVEGHVLALSRHGDIVVDTDPRVRDRRKVTMFYMVNQTFKMMSTSKGWTDEISDSELERMGLK